MGPIEQAVEALRDCADELASEVEHRYAATLTTDFRRRSPVDDIVEKLADLRKQATTERSHYYVASCCRDAITEITRLRSQLAEARKVLHRIGY